MDRHRGKVERHLRRVVDRVLPGNPGEGSQVVPGRVPFQHQIPDGVARIGRLRLHLHDPVDDRHPEPDHAVRNLGAESLEPVLAGPPRARGRNHVHKNEKERHHDRVHFREYGEREEYKRGDVRSPPKRPLSPGPQVEIDRWKEEGRGKDVFPGGDPGDGLDVGGMHREEKPGHRGEPESPEESQPHHDRERGVQRVEDDLLQVIPERFQAPETVVHDVGHELERHVAHEIGLRENVAQVLARPGADPRILGHVPRIVPAQELEL